MAFLAALLAGFIFTKGLIESRQPGWHEEGTSAAYYINEDGIRATGYQRIAGKPYFFTKEGTPTQQGWIESTEQDDRRFYCTGGGELATGWKYIDGKVWYFYQKNDTGDGRILGEMAKNYTTSGGLVIPEDGYFDGDEGLALAYGIDVLNRYGWNLTAAYKYASSLRFVAGSDEHYGFTTHSCALHGFKYGGGNCLAWSGTFCVMAKLLGYDCRQIWGTLQWKGTRPHAWTEIWENGEPHVYDPRKHDGEDMAGFDVEYGEKGSYKYDLDSREYLKW